MKQVGIAELKDHLSEHLRAVEHGAEIEITDRNRPIVRIVPASRARRPVILPSPRPFTEIRAKQFSPADWGVSSLELLLQERGER